MCEPGSGRFDMWTACVSVLLAIWPLLVETQSTLLYEHTDGWIPVRAELVYEQIKREGVQQAQYIGAHNIQLLHTDVNKALPQNILKVPEQFEPDPKKNVGDFKENVGDFKEIVGDFNENDDDCDNDDNSICNQATLTNGQIHNSNYDFLRNEFHLSTDQNQTDYKTVRRSKKITDLDFKNNVVQELFLPENTLPKTKSNTYEVTEYTSEESKLNTEGSKHEPPQKKNQTLTLFQILSKYKINKDDVLPNYILSRKHKDHTHISSELRPPVKSQKQIVQGYNNLNHLPVDPLLAVFLSNYGFYLQGLYGVQNQYNNLYGYLASNNIHNNRPFGVYKIYSDTDSSQ